MRSITLMGSYWWTMNKQVKKYYWIFFCIYLILGVAGLSLTIHLAWEGNVFFTVIIGIVTYFLLADWWKIHKNKHKLSEYI